MAVRILWSAILIVPMATLHAADPPALQNGPRSFRFPDRGAPLPETWSNCCPETQPMECPTCFIDPLHRAGHPETICRRAKPSNNCHYDGYYVGGGLPGMPLRGESRCGSHEGTWGWDYGGILFAKRTALNWGHGLRSQGGTGAYKSDGPKLRHE